MSFENDLTNGGVAYQGTGNDGIGPSDVIWGRFRKSAGTRHARFIEHDFTVEQSTFASANEQSGLVTYQDIGVTIAGNSTIDDGLEIAGNDADNDEGHIGSVSGSIGVISDTAGDAKLLAFEASVAKASVADNGLSFFIGLIEPGKVAADGLTDDDGVVVDADFIGFHVDQADGDSLDAVYKKETQAVQTVEAGCHTLVADTFVKLGFVYDPTAKSENKITFYVDGVDIGSYVTATDIAAATFPDGETMGWAFLTKVGEAAEVKANIRWVRFAQLR